MSGTGLRHVVWGPGIARSGGGLGGIALSYFCYRRRKTLAPQRPRKLPKLDVAGSTPVARSRRNPVADSGFFHFRWWRVVARIQEGSGGFRKVPGRQLELTDHLVELLGTDTCVAIVLLEACPVWRQTKRGF